MRRIRWNEGGSILCTVVLGCLVMGFIDGVVRPGYGLKSALKPVFFLLLPLLVYYRNSPAELKGLFDRRRAGLLPLVLGAGVYGGILLLYFTVGSFFDFSQVVGALDSQLGVDRENFLWVSLYISFVNSMLEEFFFRGFGCLSLRQYLPRRPALLFSALTFALYHVAMMTGWFRLDLMVLLIALLTGAGVFLCLLDERSHTLWLGWCVHAFANFAINTVGFLLFGLL